MLIPIKYKESDTTAPENGAVETTCSVCKTKYWVPADLIPQIGATPICEECGETADKIQAAASAEAAKEATKSTTDKLTEMIKKV